MASGAKMKKTEIIAETERVLVSRRGQRSIQVWCEQCARQVKMLTAEEVTSVVGVSQRTIYRWVEAEKVHFTETPDGRLLICADSLDEGRLGEKR